MSEHPIPSAALSDHMLVVAMTGSGKSYMTRGLVERMLDENRRVCIIDYTGVWYGLRSTTNGKRAAYPVVIFGGEHADIPIDERMGPAVAKFVADGNAPTIVDVDGMTVGAQQRFITAFCEELYRLNKRPLHLVLEEADEFAPMTGAPGAERMIGAVCRIFQRGRRKGFRGIAITQRPANLHTRVRGQCRTLVALQLTMPQDREAIRDWIRGHGNTDDGKRVVDSLPNEAVGEGWVWAPRQKVLEQVKFPKIRTFDSMRAPDEGEVNEPVTWASIDLKAIKGEMSKHLEEAKARDPDELRKQIDELKAEKQKLENQAATTSAQVPADPAELKKAEEKGFEQAKKKLTAGMQRELHKQHKAALGAVRGLLTEWTEKIDTELRNVAAAEAKIEVPLFEPTMLPKPSHPPVSSGLPKPAAQFKPVTANGGGALDGPIQKIIDAIRWWNVLGISGPSHAQVAFVAGYSHRSSTWSTYVARARSGGYVEGSRELTLSAAGHAMANDPAVPPSGAALRQIVIEKIDTPLRKILAPIIETYPGYLSHEQAGQAAGYSHRSSTWSTYLSRLRSLDLIEGRGELKASEWLFPF